MTSPAHQQLKSHLCKAGEGAIREPELLCLVHLARATVQAYLGHYRSSVAGLCRQHGLSVVDLSFDCVAEVFARDKNGTYQNIRNFITSLGGGIADVPDDEVQAAFRSFLMRVADAQLARLYAQADPWGAKIHRNMRDRVKDSAAFVMDKDFRGLVLRPRNQDALDHLCAFPFDELEQAFLALASAGMSTVQLLSVLHSLLTDQCAHRRSIPIVEVTQLFRKVFRYERPPDEDPGPEPLPGGLTEFEIASLCEKVAIAVKEKIVVSYLAKEKVSRRLAEAMAKAFEDLIADWAAGGGSGEPLLGYLRRYYRPGDEAEEYEIRLKMEYLLRIARQEFSARLLGDI